MDLFEKLKAQKAAREAQKAAAAPPAPRPTLAIPSAPVGENKPSTFASLRRPTAAPKAPVIPPRQSQEEISEHLTEALTDADFGDFNVEDITGDDDSEEFIDPDDVDFSAEDATVSATIVSDHHSARRPLTKPATAEPDVPHVPHVPSGTLLRRPVKAPAPETQPEPKSAEPPTAPAAPATGMRVPLTTPGAALFNSLKARAEGQPVLRAPAAHPGLTPAKQLAADNSEFDIAELLNRWPEDIEGADDAQQSELNESRAALLSEAAAYMQAKFMHELDEVMIREASDLAINDIAKISKLCFLRVKQSPSAWQLLDQIDRDTLIKGLLASAAKRTSIAKSRKPRDAAQLSGALETLTQEDPGLAEALAAFKFEV